MRSGEGAATSTESRSPREFDQIEDVSVHPVRIQFRGFTYELGDTLRTLATPETI
jgi:hypothetical protein